MRRNAKTQVYPRQPVIGLPRRHDESVSLPSLLDLPHAFTRSGRSAITLALELLGVRPGDLVLVPTYHCPTMVAPIEHLRARPLFYPIDANGRPDANWLAGLDWHGVKAMLVAHLFGIPIDLQEIAALCHRHDSALIEDCAHAFYGSVDGRPVGATGDFAVGSLPKFFPVSEGGVLASTARRIEVPARPYGSLVSEFRAVWRTIDLSARARRLGMLGSAVRIIDHTRRGGRQPDSASDRAPFEPTAAAIRTEGLADPLLLPGRISRTEAWLVLHTNAAAAAARRRRNYEALVEGLTGLDSARPLFLRCPPDSAPYVMPLLVTEPDAPYARMRAGGLPVFRWDRLWPGTTVTPGDATRAWSRGVVQIACHQSLDIDEIGALVATARRCLIGRGH